MISPGSFYVVGGTVSPESPSYVERNADRELFDRLSAGEFCYVLTSRQMGKSSVMARTARRLVEEQQCAVAIVDLTQIGTEAGEIAASQWYYSLARRIQRQLDIRCNLRAWWRRRDELTAVQRLGDFFNELVLRRIDQRIVVFVDEIDSTTSLPFSGDFFAAIRACYNERATDPRFRRLAFALLGVASPSQLMPDVQRTPFNIGYRIELDDFTIGEAKKLAQGLHGSDEHRERQLLRALYWTNGHPYLTQKTLSKLAEIRKGELPEVAVDSVVSELFTSPPIHQAEQHIADVRQFLTGHTNIIEAMQAIYRLARSANERVDDDPLSLVKSVLKLSGLLRVGGDGLLIVRNRIYEHAFVDWEVGDAFYKLGPSVVAIPEKRESGDVRRFTTAKVVLLGDHSVGKSALAYRLIHGTFKEQVSTHGQQFWIFPALGERRADGTECEAILWDFAGQPDYRLVHSLFVDDADLALVLFDASDLHDPLYGVGFWLKQLQVGQSRCPIILVAAQVDRGACALTPEELSAFCRRQGIVGPIATSSLTGLGIAELVERMKSMIPWEHKAATVATTTFKRIQDYVLGLKETERGRRTIITPAELRRSLQSTDANWRFTYAEMLTTIGHLENYGYIKRLETSKGEDRILLEPERLNNIASSFLLEARRHPKGLGALEEKRLLAGDYRFQELTDLHQAERDVLLDAAVLLFLEHNVCFRETDLLRTQPYLIFPELINLRRPAEDEPPVEDGVAYTVSGPTGNVFASLVVLLGYTHTFTRTSQWQSNARYELGDGLVCGFRQEAERDGELDLVLSFGPQVGLPARTLFQGLFESFLVRRNLTVMRYEPVRCTNVNCGNLLDRSVVRQRLKEGRSFAFCNNCGEKLTLPAMAKPIQLTQGVRAEVESQRRAAEQRTRFEQAIFRVRAYAAELKTTPPETFISYAWGVPEHDRWVEKRLATDLQKAGINVLLDRWYNAQVGASVARFVERVEKSDRIVIVGTPAYRRKYENRDISTGYVVAAEVDVINNRLLGTEPQKQSVVPLLLEGGAADSLPPLLHGRVYADFRDELGYFATAFDLILSLYRLPPNHPAVADLREVLRGHEVIE
jgi:small GTP-binding protein